MADYDKVLEGLECCLANRHNKCPYKSTDEGIDKVTCCTTYLFRDARALIREQQEQLKAQQPSLIPLEDLLDDAKAVFEVLWLERRDGNISPHRVYSNGPDSPYVHIMCFGGSTYALPKNAYLKEWRCWSLKPTADQMDQTAWEAGTDGEGD